MEASSLSTVQQGTTVADPNYLHGVLTSKMLTEDQKIGEMGKHFEMVFVNQFMDTALKPMFQGPLNQDNAKNSIYRSFLTQALSEKITRGADFGFANALQFQLQTNQKDGTHSNDGK